MDLRIGLESEAAALAAQWRTATQLELIHVALEQLDADIRSTKTAVASYVRVHEEIIRATGNRYFHDLFAQLAPFFLPGARMDLFKSDRKTKVQIRRQIQEEHLQIYEGIARRDGEAARAAMRQHLSNSRARLRAGME